MRVLVLGASGLIGSTMFRVFSEKADLEVFGSIRSPEVKRLFPLHIAERLVPHVELNLHDALIKIFRQLRPDVVINCAGLTKHLPDAENPMAAISVNALLPHRLASLCDISGARLVQVSTDCVFTGRKGNYAENDIPDAADIYGRTKILGEVDYPHAITLRTSTLGHELQSSFGLLDWFLSQQEKCMGFTRAIFSGLPTVAFAQVVRDIVIPRPDLHGLYHVAGYPIAKFDLLRVIAEIYGKSIEIIPDDRLVIDRSLNGARFQVATGYIPADWPDLIKLMHSYR